MHSFIHSFIHSDKEATHTSETLQQTNAALTKALSDIKTVEANAEKTKVTEPPCLVSS